MSENYAEKLNRNFWLPTSVQNLLDNTCEQHPGNITVITKTVFLTLQSVKVDVYLE